ncbi:hypothetical protein IWX48DRAFT_592396 [Phyllosticta citricarpa]
MEVDGSIANRATSPRGGESAREIRQDEGVGSAAPRTRSHESIDPRADVPYRAATPIDSQCAKKIQGRVLDKVHFPEAELGGHAETLQQQSRENPSRRRGMASDPASGWSEECPRMPKRRQAQKDRIGTTQFRKMEGHALSINNGLSAVPADVVTCWRRAWRDGWGLKRQRASNALAVNIDEDIGFGNKPIGPRPEGTAQSAAQRFVWFGSRRLRRLPTVAGT